MRYDEITSNASHDELEVLQRATLGRYAILQELGRGGMGTVFLADDLRLQRRVAIKVLPPSMLREHATIERFRREARTAANLDHPNVIPVYALSETDDPLYFVMKVIAGRPLDAIVESEAPLPIPVVTAILIEMGLALDYAHSRGVIHRDIKPSNVILDAGGSPILTDFGIAKLENTDSTVLTSPGVVIGTIPYMSPEQCMGRSATAASDQYAVGIMAYEMLSGTPPFTGSVPEVITHHVSSSVPPIQDLRPDCPGQVAECVERMLHKDPAERWPSLQSAVEALRAYRGTVEATAQSMADMAARGPGVWHIPRVSIPKSPVIPRPTQSRRVRPVDQDPAPVSVSKSLIGGRILWLGLLASLAGGGAYTINRRLGDRGSVTSTIGIERGDTVQPSDTFQPIVGEGDSVESTIVPRPDATAQPSPAVSGPPPPRWAYLTVVLNGYANIVRNGEERPSGRRFRDSLVADVDYRYQFHISDHVPKDTIMRVQPGRNQTVLIVLRRNPGLNK